jgi:hypothetical protein
LQPCGPESAVKLAFLPRNIVPEKRKKNYNLRLKEWSHNNVHSFSKEYFLFYLCYIFLRGRPHFFCEEGYFEGDLLYL